MRAALSSSRVYSIPTTELRESLADLLVEYRGALDSGSDTDPGFWVRRLFRLLGWGEGVAAITPHRRVIGNGGEAEILECDVFGYGVFKVAILPRNPQVQWEVSATEVIDYLYNHGDEWAVVSDFNQLEIVNVRWAEKQRGYLAFRRLLWEDYPEQVHTLSLLTPARIQDRDLFEQGHAEAPRKKFTSARSGERTQRPPIIRVVLDQILSSRSAFLHDPPESAGHDPEQYDEQIHRLLTRLIFVRACEDMSVGVSAPLDTLLRAESQSSDLDQILASYKTQYDSELFGELNLDVFRWSLVQRAIRSLYRAADVVEFNFAAMEADILGMMYEEYLQWRAVRVEDEGAGDQRVLFQLKRVSTENVRREQGIYYTPEFLVSAMVDKALELVGAPSGWFTDSMPVRVGDLACGSGAFLASAFERIGSNQPDSTYRTAAELLPRVISGIDVDRRAVEATRLNLWLTLFRLHPEVHPLPRLADAVFARDSLIGALEKSSVHKIDQSLHADLFAIEKLQLLDAPDLILGNPPFVSIERLDLEYRNLIDQEGYDSATGRYDLANLFVERALATVRVGGIVALVVPNRIFLTAAAASLRKVIAKKADIEYVIDFGTEQVFPATTYVSVVFLRRRAGISTREAADVPVLRVDRLSDPRGLQLRQALSGFATEGIREYRVRIPRTSAPVLLVPGRASQLVRKLLSHATPLRELAQVSQGIKLGAQELYLVVERAAQSREDGMMPVYSFGKVHGAVLTDTLEEGALRPAGHSSDIQRYREPRKDLWVIYPYENGELIEFGEYAERYPSTAKYLSKHRSLLARRVTSRPDSWHGLARPRDERWLRSQKILVPQLATEGRMTLDERGLYLVQGFGVTPFAPDQLQLLLGALNSTLLVWLTAVNAPKYRGNSFEYQAGVLESLPIPTRLLQDDSYRKQLEILTDRLLDEYRTLTTYARGERLLQLEAEADALVYAAAGLTFSEVQLIEEEVARFRPSAPLDRPDDLFAALRSRAVAL